jgi:predicted transcriptional regulator
VVNREEEIFEVLKKHSAYELAQLYFFNVEGFCGLVLEVLDLGTLATKLFLVLYRHRREWTTVELGRSLKAYRPNVYVALLRLEKKQFIERISRNRWRLSERYENYTL